MKNLDYEALKAEWQKEWNEKGEKYAKAVNDMVAFAEVHGWDAYEGEDPVDEREGTTQLCEAVFELLKDANERGETEKFRADFPPSNVIFDKKLRKKLRDIDQICPLGRENVLFIASNDDGKSGGELVARFSHELEIIYDEAEILPFNDGSKVLLAAHDGIF